MDPSVLVALVGVGGVAVGAVLTAAVSLFTGWMDRRHEHRRWLLDQRLAAFIEYKEAIRAFEEARGHALPEQLTKMKSVKLAQSKVLLVAPQQTATDIAITTNTAVEMLANWAMNEDDTAAYSQLQDRLTRLDFRLRADVQISRRDRRQTERALRRPRLPVISEVAERVKTYRMEQDK